VAVHSHNVTFAWNGAVAEVVSISGLGFATPAKDTTHLGSTDATRTKDPGLIDPKDFSLTLWFTKSQLATFYAQRRVKGAYTLTIPTHGTWTGQCFTTDVGMEIPLDEMIELSVDFAQSGLPVWASI
jgi:hypothetical protein